MQPKKSFAVQRHMKKPKLPLKLLAFLSFPAALHAQEGAQNPVAQQASVQQSASKASGFQKMVHLDGLMQDTDASRAQFTLALTQISEYEFDGTLIDRMNQIKASGGFVKVGKKYLEDGHFVYYHPNGKIESEGEFVKGIKVGYWKRYDANGTPKQDRYYPAESADKIRALMQLEKVDEEGNEK